MISFLTPLFLTAGINLNGVVNAVIPSKDISIYDVKKEIAPITNPLAETTEYKQKIKITATAYTASINECGKNDGITASGTKASYSRGTIAVPHDVPFGTQVEIPSMNKIYISEDRGSASHIKWIDPHTMRIDIFMNSKFEANQFGVQNLEGYIYKRVKVIK